MPSSSAEPRRQQRVVCPGRELPAPGVEAEAARRRRRRARRRRRSGRCRAPRSRRSGARRRRTGCAVPTGRRGSMPGGAITVTGSKRAMASTTAAYSASASARRPSQSSARQGQDTNVRACSAVLLGTNSESSARTRHHGLLGVRTGGWRTVAAALGTAAPRCRAPDSVAGVSERADVVVIGGGLVGTSIAYQLCRRGAGRVVLLERDGLGSGDSGRTFGMVRRHYSNAVTALLALRGSHTIMHWDEEVGVGDVGLRRDRLPAAGARGARRTPAAPTSRGSRRSGSRRRSSHPPRSPRSSRCSRSTASPAPPTSPTAASPTPRR